MVSALPEYQWSEGSLGRMLADQSPSGLALVDADMSIIYLNSALAGFCGRDENTLLGRPFLELFDADSTSALRQLAGQIDRQPRERLSCRLLRPDQSPLEVQVMGMWVEYQGRQIHLFGINDVSDREQLLKSLAQSDERFRIATTLTREYIYDYDREKDRLQWSENVHELLGFRAIEMPQDLRGMINLTHPDDRKRLKDALLRHAANDENFSEEYRIRRKDGSCIMVLHRSTAVRDAEGRATRWIGAVSDVTEARRMEDELRSSEERFRIAASLVTDYIYEFSAEKNTFSWSSDLSNLLGYGPEEMPTSQEGMNGLVHPDDLQRVTEAIVRHAMDRTPFHEEYRIRRRDGNYIMVSNRATPVRDPDGKVRRWVGAASDVTEARRIEEELRDSEAKFWSFVNESVYGYSELDLDANVTFANARAEAIIGYSFGSGTRINLREFLAPEEHGRAFHNLDLVHRQTNEGPREYVVRHQDGRLVHVEINTHPLRRGGKIIGYQNTVLDITRRKMMEEEDRRRESILQAVARGAESFLRSASWRDHILEVLEDVGLAAQVKRSYIFSIIGSSDEKMVGELFDWMEGRVRQPDIPEKLNRTDWRNDPLLQRAIEALRRGEAFTGHYRDFIPEVAQVFPQSTDMTFQGVPIFVSGELWGAFGFDYLNDTALDSPAEIDILKVLANTLGAAIQREQADKIIHESERRYRLVIENLMDAIWTADMDFNVTYFSPSIARLTGYTVEEAVKNRPEDVLYPESLADFGRILKEVMDQLEQEKVTGERRHLTSSTEIRVKHKDGRKIWMEVAWSVTRDPAGNPSGFQGTMRDVTRRKAAEQALKLSEEKLRAQYNAIPVPTYTWQREGEDFILVDFNEAAVAITKGLIRDHINAKATEFFHNDQEILDDLDRCYREQSVFERELNYHFPRANVDKVFTAKFAFVAPDQVIAHTEDITEKKRAMERLAESEAQLKQTLSTEVQMRRSKDYAETENADENLHLYGSAAWQRTLSEARIAAQSDGVVMLLGKSGVGKTYLAGWIHQHSSRADGPYFDINCAALTPSLVESELFGHEAGAFTGSKGRRRGLIELANNGTLFLDEIGDMPLDLQAKLLSFLDTRRFMRVGGESKLPANSRIMVATNRDLPALVQKGSFREDLYYRLNVFTIAVPALSERKDDIPMLTAGLLHRLAREMGLPHPPVLTPEAIRLITNHPWPGNVRELKNVLERVLLKSENKSIITEVPLTLAAAPAAPVQSSPAGAAPGFLAEGQNFDQAVEAYMEALVKNAIEKTRTKTEAARLLGISRHALNRYCRKYGLT